MNGVFIFNKPKGITSHDVIYMFRKKLNIKKVGHTGTLDPIATGVLPICIGKATKIAQYITAEDKEYIATMKFGIETDTLDITGDIIHSDGRIPLAEEVVESLVAFKGEIHQKPPMYSAIKVKGRKLYEYARDGIEVDVQERLVKISDISLLKKVSTDTFVIKINCSSGTYIRSLIRDIGYSLNTFATMTDLVRTRSGNFNIDNSIDEITLKASTIDDLKKSLIPIDAALNDFEAFEFPDEFYFRALNGVPFKTQVDIKENKLLRLYCKNEFIAIGEYKTTEEFSGIKIKKLLIGD